MRDRGRFYRRTWCDEPDAPNNPLHRERWARMMARNRYAALQELNIEPIRQGVVITEHFIGGKWAGRSRAPMTLPRVRFIEGERHE